MALDRRDIERTNFSSVRRGYDPAEVDEHLRAVADSVESVIREASQDRSASGAASRGVKQILDAAETLASELEAQARKEGERIQTEARLQGEKLLEQARQRAAAEEKRAQRAGERLKRANSELGRLREALAGLHPVAPEGEEEAASQPTRATEVVGVAGDAPATAHAEPTNGDGAAEQAQESTADAAHEAAPEAGDAVGSGDGEGARLIALNMALTGTPREETARYLEENFELEDAEKILDDAYSRAG